MIRPHKGVYCHLVGVKAVGHHAGLLRFLSRQHRQQRRHGLRRGSLRSAAEGDGNAPCSNRAVKALHQSPAAGAFQAGRHLPEIFQSGLSKCGAVCRRHGNRRVLRGAVGIQKRPGNIRNGLPLPAHDHPGTFRNDRYPVRL